MKASSKKNTGERHCLCCGRRNALRKERAGIALEFLGGGSHALAGEWLLADSLGYCSIHCLEQMHIAPIVAMRLWAGAQ